MVCAKDEAMKIETAEWRNPFLVAAFGGWGDAASVATTSASFLMQGRQSRRLGELDAEEYFVLTETRPLVRLDEAGQPNPKVCVALLRAVDQLLDLKLDLRELEDAARTFEKQVGLAMTRSGQT